MAEIRPLRAVRYEPSAVGSLDAVAAPPYDVIDDEMRAKLVSKSPFNVVEIDLPRRRRRRRPVPARADDVRALAAAGHPRARARGLDLGAHPELRGPGRQRVHAPWLLRARARRGLRPRAGSARTSARTPGPKEDRLNLTRATRANLSPIFSLFPDPEDAAWRALEPHTQAEPFDEVARRRRHPQPPLAHHRPGHDRGGPLRPRRQGAPDRRRPPPLRDRARVRETRSAARASTSGC